MFAIALWDVNGRSIFLIRDRMGEKPLYYGWQNTTLMFSSELKAMRAHPDFQDDINRDSLSLYFRYQYIPTPYSIFRNVYKLEPGTMLKIPLDECRKSGKYYFKGEDKVIYWSLKEEVEKAEIDTFNGTPNEAAEELEALLLRSVEGQMVSDVPLGAFLSGGVDSSTIVALMQKMSTRPINTFCMGFHEKEYNEAAYAKEIARHLGCNHTELYVTPQQAREVMPNISRWYDEPFSDPSQIPTYLVSRLARE